MIIWKIYEFVLVPQEFKKKSKLLYLAIPQVVQFFGIVKNINKLGQFKQKIEDRKKFRLFLRHHFSRFQQIYNITVIQIQFI